MVLHISAHFLVVEIHFGIYYTLLSYYKICTLHLDITSCQQLLEMQHTEQVGVVDIGNPHSPHLDSHFNIILVCYQKQTQ